MLVAIFWAALFLVVYTYLIYPVLLWLLAAGRKMPEYAPLSEWPEASLIIAAHNEEAVLRAKLENALAMDYPAERLDIIVVSDASTDDTDRIAAEFAVRGVRRHRQEVRGGKTEAQNAGVRLARGQFVAFSDANSMYAPSALKRLLAPFADERIGCVCGELQYANPDEQGAGKGEGLYWRYEQFLKRRESLLSSALGANGAIYALRRELFVELRGDIISDFVAPLHAWRRGFRIAYEPTAVATEYSSGRFGDEFRRRRRIVSRSLYGLWTEAGVLNPFAHFLFAFQMFSHKLLRWLVPVWLLVVLAVNIPLAESEYYDLLLALQVTFYGLAALGLLLPERFGRYWLFYVPAYFTATNWGTLLGLLSFLMGRRHRVWQPAR
ncbi:MAG: glycosyltransferase family 2 protein [Gemmatimonadetes bacterium]|nr:glycosyltransferase family 2 protein [Gemmatimonadota bacterium]MXY80567.1 glycosyltransferase family 2 protein [Gemmatimonadota bacterium]MYA22678.1 glycosyltransferase family 2 protein [Gemmatimonadota bacterium]MYB71367.1 glycosyltransferase family 2 protein [Gemmatimonadota bacterium]